MKKILFIIFLFLDSSLSWAVSVSTYRIYLDRDNNINDYVVSNRTLNRQSCHLDFTHYQFDSAGNLSKYDNENYIPTNSATEIVRYSPKNFVIEPKTTQKIRFSLRNKRGIETVEYRSHVIVSCTDINDTNQQDITTQPEFAAVTVKPILRHHIPLVVRPHSLDVALDIQNIVLVGNQLSFDLVRSGARSLYGQVNIQDQEGRLITSSRKFPLYHEVTSKNVSISLPEFNADSLTIEFIEDDEVVDRLTTSATFVIK